MFYNQAYQVPYWTVIGETQRPQTIVKWLLKAEALKVDWPANSYPDTVEFLKQRGWAHAFEVPDGYPMVMSPDFMTNSIDTHVRQYLRETHQFSFMKPAHTLNRKIRLDDNMRPDLMNLFNSFLKMQEDIVLSHAFQIGERCYKEGSSKRYKMFFSEAPCNQDILSRLAQKIITVGEGSIYTIDITGVKSRQLGDFLNDKFPEVM